MLSSDDPDLGPGTGREPGNGRLDEVAKRVCADVRLRAGTICSALLESPAGTGVEVDRLYVWTLDFGSIVEVELKRNLALMGPLCLGEVARYG